MTPSEIQKYIDKRHQENVATIGRLGREMTESHRVQEAKMDELLKAFNNTTAFFKVSIAVAKYIIVLGTAFTVVFTAINWLKK